MKRLIVGKSSQRGFLIGGGEKDPWGLLNRNRKRGGGAFKNLVAEGSGTERAIEKIQVRQNKKKKARMKLRQDELSVCANAAIETWLDNVILRKKVTPIEKEI